MSSTATNREPLRYPAGALLRVKDICGDRRAGRAGLLPIASRTWLKWVEQKKVPQGLLLGGTTRAWRIEDVMKVASECEAPAA